MYQRNSHWRNCSILTSKFLKIKIPCRKIIIKKTFFQKANLIPGGNDSVVYTTLSGSVGMLVPFTSHEDYDFFQHLVCSK